MCIGHIYASRSLWWLANRQLVHDPSAVLPSPMRQPCPRAPRSPGQEAKRRRTPRPIGGAGPAAVGPLRPKRWPSTAAPGRAAVGCEIRVSVGSRNSGRHRTAATQPGPCWRMATTMPSSGQCASATQPGAVSWLPWCCMLWATLRHTPACSAANRVAGTISIGWNCFWSWPSRRRSIDSGCRASMSCYGEPPWITPSGCSAQQTPHTGLPARVKASIGAVSQRSRTRSPARSGCNGCRPQASGATSLPPCRTRWSSAPAWSSGSRSTQAPCRPASPQGSSPPSLGPTAPSAPPTASGSAASW